MATRVLNGYPQSGGAKIESIVSIDGPASYANGTGQAINASNAGMSHLEYVGGGASDDGTYFVLGAVSQNNNPVASINLFWYVSSSGAEVGDTTDLSASHVRLFVRGV